MSHPISVTNGRCGSAKCSLQSKQGEHSWRLVSCNNKSPIQSDSSSSSWSLPVSHGSFFKISNNGFCNNDDDDDDSQCCTTWLQKDRCLRWRVGNSHIKSAEWVENKSNTGGVGNDDDGSTTVILDLRFNTSSCCCTSVDPIQFIFRRWYLRCLKGHWREIVTVLIPRMVVAWMYWQ